ncbi:MAG: hypothetical protein ABR562_05645, partial [Thermoplasmatota archaeon]
MTAMVISGQTSSTAVVQSVRGLPRARLQPSFAGAAAVLVVLAIAAPSAGQALVNNGTIAMGVRPHGNLGIANGLPSNQGNQVTSVHHMPSHFDGMDNDMEGEGWGLNYDGAAGPVGWADSAVTGSGPTGSFSTPPPTLVSFTPNTALTCVTSVVKVGDIQMTQAYCPHATVPEVYRDDITFQNVGPVVHNNILYRRQMAWGMGARLAGGTSISDAWTGSIDVLPAGSTPPPAIIKVGQVDFATNLNPLLAWTPRNTCGVFFPTTCVPTPPTGEGPPGQPGFQKMAPPSDDGIVWDFNFGTLNPGEQVSATLFYGAAPTRAQAIADLNAVGAQEYNLMQSTIPTSPGSPN